MPKAKPKIDKRFIALTLIFVIGLYIILPQLGDFKASRHLLSHPKIAWLPGALAFISLTYFAAAGTYYFLAFRKLNYWRTVVVELAAMFINRLLPGGVGALGANYLYLKRNHNNAGQAGTIVAINNTLGFVGHALLSVMILLAYSGHMVTLDSNESKSWAPVIKYALVGLIAALVIGLVAGRHRIKKLMAEIGTQLLSYKRQPWKLLAALITSMLLTSCNALCLYFCMQAIGFNLSFMAVFLIFSFGVSAGTATPTPGGLGGYEAALTAGFVAYGVPGAAALAIALLYRLISYWVPLLGGSIAFVYSQRRRYI
jgi:uncharacterized protein (TIRG00374 family)